MGQAQKIKGFTLVELAIVLVIIGLLVGMGVGLIGPLTKRAKLMEARDTVNQAKEAFFGYANKMGYLPASGNYDPITPVSAFENVGAKGIDPYGKALLYRVANELAGNTNNICKANATSLTITEGGTPRSNIAFMIVSGGENYNIQTLDTIHPIGTDNVDDFPNDMNRPEPYDDIVAYVALDELRVARGCPKELGILGPDTLPTAKEDMYYSYQFQATGGYPPYTWTVQGQPSYLTISPQTGLLSGTINYNSSTSTGELQNCSETIPGINVTVTDSSSPPGTNTKVVSLDVVPQPLNIVSQHLPAGQMGSSYSAQIVATGGKVPRTYSATGLPTALSINPTTGAISGTINDPTPGQCSPNVFPITVNVTDNCPSGGVSKQFSLSVEDPECYGGGGTTTTTSTTTTTTIPGTTTTTSTTTTTIPPAPSCTLSANPTYVPYGQSTTLTWTIQNGPANGQFSPQSGGCTQFSNSTGGSCTTGNLTQQGPLTFTLTVQNPYGSSSCSVPVKVGCQNYRVWNSTGATRDFTIDSFCRNNVGNNSEITQPAQNRQLGPGEDVDRHQSTQGSCNSPVVQSITYNDALQADTDTDCQVNFTLSGASDR